MTAPKNRASGIDVTAANVLAIYREAGPSGRLPTQEDLAARLRVSDTSIRGAIKALEQAGLIVRSGRGRSARTEIVGTSWTLTCIAKSYEAQERAPIGFTPDDRNGAVQTEQWIAVGNALGIRFEDRRVPVLRVIRGRPGPAMHSECGVSTIYEVRP